MAGDVFEGKVMHGYICPGWLAPGGTFAPRAYHCHRCPEMFEGSVPIVKGSHVLLIVEIW